MKQIKNRILSWIKKHKIATAIIIIILLTFAVVPPPDDESGEISQATSSEEQVSDEAQQEAEEKVLYELVSEDGNVKSVVILKQDPTEEDIKAVGKQIDSEYGDEDFIRIGIFSNKEQATIHTNVDAVLELKGKNAEKYDDAYVAQYNINQATGLKEYILYPSKSAQRVSL